AGTNEAHPAIDLVPVVGLMALRLLDDADLAGQARRILLWCDNPFRSILERALSGTGATVETIASAQQLDGREPVDAVLVAMRPGRAPIVGTREARVIADTHPGAMV